MQYIMTSLASSVLLLFLPTLVRSHSSNTKLLLISLDGFRHDYLDVANQKGYLTPNLDSLRSEGVFSEVQSVFPSKSLSTHYSIVTGLYPESHGLVHEEFYDPVYNETYDRQLPDDIMWFNGTKETKLVEPIWITNQITKHTLFHRRSGVYLWPGGEVSYNRNLPFHFSVNTNATKFLPFEVRARNMVNWFHNEEAPANFGAIYMPEPAATARKYGALADETFKKIEELDKEIGLLVSLLEKRDLFHHMHIIITSGQGMADRDESKMVYLNDYLDPDSYQMFGDHQMFQILPQPDDEATQNMIYEKLKNVTGLEVYLKGSKEFPWKKYHYEYCRRIMPIVVQAQLGYSVLADSADNYKLNIAEDGYSPYERDMHPFFLARGPAFKKNYTSAKIVKQVDLFPLMCNVLKIEQRRHEGELSGVSHLLEEEEEEGHYNTILTFLLVIVFAALIAGVCCVAVCRVYRVHIRRRRQFSHLQAFPPHNRIGTSSSAALLSESDDEI